MKKFIKLQKANIDKKTLSSIKKHRSEIKDIVSGKDDRILLIIGPCSAYPVKSTIEYAKRLSDLQDRYSDKIKFVMRVYTQKPRTSLGWKGILYQPNPCKAPSLKTGINAIFKMMQKISDIGLAIADEALFLPETSYYEEYLSYMAIGARSSEDQMHRNFAGTRDIAVGIKNPTSGDLRILANSVLSTKKDVLYYSEGVFFYSKEGNKYTHSILRGGGKPNYNEKSFKEAINLQKDLGIDARIVIDTNHANSGKDYLKQPKIVRSVLKYALSKENKKHFLGFMIESFLKDGNQSIDCKKGIDPGGLSITDPSLGWEKTKDMIDFIYKSIKSI